MSDSRKLLFIEFSPTVMLDQSEVVRMLDLLDQIAPEFRFVALPAGAKVTSPDLCSFTETMDDYSYTVVGKDTKEMVENLIAMRELQKKKSEVTTLHALTPLDHGVSEAGTYAQLHAKYQPTKSEEPKRGREFI